MAAAVAAGVPLCQAAEAMARVEPVDGRMSVHELDCGATIIRDDWKAPRWTIEAMVYLDAMLSERTWIASDVDGAREVVRDDETGVLFRTGDVGDFAWQILQVAGDPTLRARIGSQAREYAMCHSDQAIGAMYEASLRYVCRSSARQGPTYAAR